jgi:hypothetical protein
MRVAWIGDADYIDIGVGEHFVIAVIHPADIVFFSKSHSLAVRPVTYGKQISSAFLQSGGCFIGYNTCAEYLPAVVFRNMLLLDTAVENKASAGGF